MVFLQGLKVARFCSFKFKVVSIGSNACACILCNACNTRTCILYLEECTLAINYTNGYSSRIPHPLAHG